MLFPVEEWVERAERTQLCIILQFPLSVFCTTVVSGVIGSSQHAVLTQLDLGGSPRVTLSPHVDNTQRYMTLSGRPTSAVAV